MAYVIKNANDEIIKHDGIEVFMTIMNNCVKGVNMATRTLDMIGSDETVDRDGDILTVSGWDLKNFLNNPVFLWSHQYSGPESVPLARAIKVVKKRSPGSLQFTMQFPTEGINPFADMILNLYNEKIINASSVGFIPREWEPVDGSSEESFFYGGGRRFLKQELLELSGCAVPCNPAALQNAVKGFVHPQSPKEYVGKVVNWLMGKTAPDAKLIGVDEVELNGELQEMKCVVEEEGPTMVQVPDNIDMVTTEKVASQGVDNTEEKDYNLKNDVDCVVTTPETTCKGDEMTIKYNFEGIEVVDMKDVEITYFKATKSAENEVTFEPVDPKDLESKVDLEGKLALVFGQNITVVEPKELVELLGIPQPSTEATPAKEEEAPETPVVPPLDTKKLLDSLKALSQSLPEVK
jgi:hypothetical protein